MPIGKTHVLISEYQAIKTDGSDALLIAPSNLVDFGAYASQVTFIISIARVSGDPSAWSLGARFEYGMASTDGWIYSQPRWFTLQPENIATNVVEGVGWGRGPHQPPTDGGFGIIADQSDSLAEPITVQRTVRHFGQRVRLRLDPKFTGGTDPAIHATVLAIAGG